ncbi:MAG: UDP-N-acetylmuramoyl-L-alanyl-D-glutamate--2,6-diaminopimelate ligase [Bacteroides uniformis]|uniref:UDP-N-acetylmuramoyl-L-alanyl-D-glutamate--2,6-diaminopimelate ligase n=1 Tax=Bacteroides uniformis TaxID=820 RepID=A0A1Q6HQ61_BACUN|nr:MAG: UDP-N-acetylmuramoyl-L-alanyl-D-glutamate--2,6-diaminopimelate ligase [Bacteroides uniformis]
MQHNLQHLISAINPVRTIGPTDRTVTSLTDDSRKVTDGAMFVAVRGVTVDGHTFIPSLADKHPAAIVVETMPDTLFDGVTYIQVDNSAIALGFLASQWYGNPSRRLRLVGVTGTNGKTTTATLIYEMARLGGHKAGLLSTVCNYVDSRAVAAKQTTPDPLTINMLLHEMVEEGCEYAAMEVSSHAADQHRIAGLTFAGGVFTNLTRDHLDYHKTFDAYLAAKKSFFDMLPAEAFALTNIDDKVGEVMLQNTRAKKLSYSLRAMADFRGRIIESHLDGTLMSFNGNEVHVLFTGRFNAYNLTAVYGASVMLGWDKDDVLRRMSMLVPVAGRFQTIHSPAGVTAIVDYAHTPDAVVNVLEAIREVIGTSGNIITVVGAGGNRDKGKRPIMAREAALRSDRLILTSDNPRFEEPDDILADMRVGVADSALADRTLVNADRREAIRMAAALARKGDVILIAGKGHEDYQEIKGVKHHFDDREVVKEIFGLD